MRRNLYDLEHDEYRTTVREFVAREVTPHLEEWDERHLTGREVWLKAAEQGIVGLAIPEEYGGAGVTDWRYRNVVCEELFRVGASAVSNSFSLQDDIVTPYLLGLGNEEQKRRWVPGMAEGRLLVAIAMTEPGTGSDLRGVRTSATRTADGWRLNGSKTFVSSGQQADAVIVVARDTETSRISLFVVEATSPGFVRGRNLEKVGLWAQDTSELFFEDVLVPEANLLGTEGEGFAHLMHNLPLERLSIAAGSVAAASSALDWTLSYTKDRHAFGRPVAEFQNSTFVLADCATEIDVARAYLDTCITALNDGSLTAVDASKAKLFCTEMQGRVIDRCVQLHGGYGYMLEFPIAKAYVDARVQRIYGGTSEIQRQIIGRDLVGAG